MTHAPVRGRRHSLDRTRALPAPVRHGSAAAMVGAMAALPLLGMPVVPEGQPFLLIWAIIAAAVLFGRATALSAALVATLAGAGLLLPSTGDAAADAVRTGLSLVAFLVVALGVAAAVEAMRRLSGVMDVADARRRDPGVMPVPVPAGTRQGAPPATHRGAMRDTRPGAMRVTRQGAMHVTRPGAMRVTRQGAMRVLLMTPEERRRRFAR